MMNVVKTLLRKVLYLFLLCIDKIRGVDFVSKGNKFDYGNRYEMTSVFWWRELRTIFLELGVSEKDYCIDVGCDKGGAIAQLSKLPFGRVDGLEYSLDLANVCKKNMKKLGITSTVYVGDAAVFSNYRKYNYFYMFNPFPENTMKEFIAKLDKSFREEPRKMIIVYFNPQCGGVLTDAGWKPVRKGEISVYRKNVQ